MRRPAIPFFVALIGCGILASAHAADPDASLRDAASELAHQKNAAALAAATAALDARPTAAGYRLRAAIRSRMDQHADALADLDAAIKLAPDSAAACASRGDEYFFLGKFAPSLADYDRQITLTPQAAAGHWQRGIACYYAGKYAEGARQFSAYHSKIDDNDVENAIWRCMCMTRDVGLEKARDEMLVVKHDGRVGMMEAYQMFAGKVEPAAVLKAAQADAAPEQSNQQQFYAHLYVGLFYDTTGHADLARSHLREAEKHRIDHFMWEVARVQVGLLNKQP